jgi:hypothetical protein
MRAATILVITVLSGSTVWAQQYRSTTLPFSATLSMSAGGVISETVGEDGKVHPSCGSLSVKGLKLGDRNVPLKSLGVTDDCKIETKDFGNVLLKVNYATFAAQVLVTTQQEEAFKKFLASAAPSPAKK